MKIRGYIVRWGEAASTGTFYASQDDVITMTVTAHRTKATEFTTLDEAAKVVGLITQHVRIVAVLDDGADLPLPSYEEALEQTNKAMAREAAVCAAWAKYYEFTENVWCAAVAATMRDQDVGPHRERREAAKQALRDLGVDVDRFLKEARAQ